MNICFVSNFEKTKVFDSIAQELSNCNINIFWIAVNKNYYQFLVERYPEESVLLLNKKIEQIETTFNKDCKLNEIVYNDRFLSKNLNEGVSFLKKAQGHIYNFLVENRIRAIFGELTWAHELLISRIANQIIEFKCNYYNPHGVRIPNGRFAFFEKETEYIEIDHKVSYGDLNAPLLRLEKPDYAKRNEEKIKESLRIGKRFQRLTNFITGVNIEKNDPSLLYDFGSRLKRGVSEEFNKNMYRNINRKPLNYVKNKKYVLLTLHKQPEASIDVLGKYYNDQLILAHNIWQILPQDWFLVVKEHSNAIGDRGINFYKNITSLPNAILIDELCDSHKLIEQSEAVFTVSGTIAYEAALLEKTSFTFASVFFNEIKFCHQVYLSDFVKYNSLYDLIETKNKNNSGKMDIQTFSNFLYANTFVGQWSPAREETFSPQNIKSLVSAILNKLNYNSNN